MKIEIINRFKLGGLALGLLLAGCNWMNDSDVAVEEQDDVCANYCELMTANCSGDNRQYRTAGQCEAVCDALDIGKKGDEEGNTAYCRVHFVKEAEESPGIHCPAAGPGGDGVCGDNCESFCYLQTAICSGDDRQYPTITECVTECEEFDQSDVYASSAGAGDTFACRLAQLVMAATSPEVYCPNIAVESPVCQ